MRPFVRGPEPDFLAYRSQALGADWQKKRSEKPSARFRWPQIEGVPLNQRLLPFLKAQTQDHCSFCDQFPVSPPSIDTVEHFRPKSRYPLEALAWGNLYYCYCYCQQKGEAYSDALLRPDADDYTFDRFFGGIAHREGSRSTIVLRQKVSFAPRKPLKAYRLNEQHTRLRRRELMRWSRGVDESLDDFAYRHFIAAD